MLQDSFAGITANILLQNNLLYYRDYSVTRIFCYGYKINRQADIDILRFKLAASRQINLLHYTMALIKTLINRA